MSQNVPVPDARPPAQATQPNDAKTIVRKVVEYKILKASWSERLETQVNAYIQKGWEPIGGIGISVMKGDETMYQTMVRYQP